MKIGYARVSTIHQNLDAQIKALQDAGCNKIYSEKQSSTNERKELSKLLKFVREGETIVVTKLDRLGRNIIELIKLLNTLNERKVKIIALDDGIDTSTQMGKLMFSLFALFAEMEHTFQKERRARAREMGRAGGRPQEIDQKTIDIICTLYQAKDEEGNYKFTVKQIAEKVNLSRPSVYKCLNQSDIQLRIN